MSKGKAKGWSKFANGIVCFAEAGFDKTKMRSMMEPMKVLPVVKTVAEEQALEKGVSLLGSD